MVGEGAVFAADARDYRHKFNRIEPFQALLVQGLEGRRVAARLTRSGLDRGSDFEVLLVDRDDQGRPIPAQDRRILLLKLSERKARI
jgi:hypothetical protein